MSDHDKIMLNSFNNLAEEFVEKMVASFPNEPKLRGYQATFLTTKRFNNKKPVEFFMNTLLPYGEQILQRNECFFKQDNLVERAQSFSGQTGLTKYWETISQDDKNSIWEYIQTLYILGMNAIGRSEQLNELLKKNLNK
jgi:hypothetical protein